MIPGVGGPVSRLDGNGWIDMRRDYDEQGSSDPFAVRFVLRHFFSANGSDEVFRAYPK